MNAGLYDVFAIDVERVVDDDRRALRLRIERRGDCLGRARQHAGKLIHRDDVVIPCVLEGFWSRSAGKDIVELSTHYQGPCIVQTLERIWACTQPRGRKRSLLSRIGEQFVLAHPALLVCL